MSWLYLCGHLFTPSWVLGIVSLRCFVGALSLNPIISIISQASFIDLSEVESCGAHPSVEGCSCSPDVEGSCGCCSCCCSMAIFFSNSNCLCAVDMVQAISGRCRSTERWASYIWYLCTVYRAGIDFCFMIDWLCRNSFLGINYSG